METLFKETTYQLRAYRKYPQSGKEFDIVGDKNSKDLDQVRSLKKEMVKSVISENYDITYLIYDSNGKVAV